MKVEKKSIWRDDGTRFRYVRPEIFVIEPLENYGLMDTIRGSKAHVGDEIKYDESITGGNFVGGLLGVEDIGVGGGANTGNMIMGEDLTYSVGRGQSVKRSIWDPSF